MAHVTEPREILDVLRKLQAIDDEIRDVREGRDAMIGNLERLTRVLEHRDGQLGDMRGKLTEAESWYTKKSGELETEHEKLQKAKAKLSGVTRSREYVAVNRELDNIRRNIGNRDDEVTRLATAIEEFRNTIGREEEKVAELRILAVTEESNNASSLGKMDSQIAEVEARRGEVTKLLEPRLVRKYDKVFKARDSIAVCAVADGVCAGCNMVVQPRFVAQIMRGSSLVQCPHCNRYLYADSGHDMDGQVIANA